MITVQDCVDFLRKYAIHKDWSDIQLADQVLNSLKNNLLAYEVDKNNKLKSIVLAKWHGDCCIRIITIAGQRGSLNNLIKHLRDNYPQIKTLEAARRGKPVTYSTARLYGRLK